VTAAPVAILEAEAAVRDMLGGLNGWLADWWLPVVLVALLLEGIPVGGFVAPGLVLLVFAGFKASAQPAYWGVLIFLACLAALVTGDFLAFGIGRWARARSARLQGWFERRLPHSERWRRAAFGTVIFYQFPPYSRMIFPALLGSSGIPLSKWAGVCLSASLLFTIVAFGAGFLGGRVGGDFVAANQQVANIIAILSIAFLLAAGSLIMRLFRSSEKDSGRNG